MNKIKLELLSPAKNLETGIAAIDCGADAVYIGAPSFGAREAAGNSIEDIEKLVSYAHKFWAKVFITVNTIIFDDELEEVRQLITSLYDIGADAVIFQDMAILEMELPPIPLYASTQTHNYELERIKLLDELGIKRIILARELTIEEIKNIKKEVSAELEFFIHGSNCMAYSGRCLLSNYMNYRDSNQGVCNNACRFQYKVYKSDDPNYMETMQDDRNYKELSKGSYFVEEQLRKGELYEVQEDESGTYIFNAKDNCMVEHIEKLMKAGVCSYKVEGRTKSVYYAAIVARVYRKVFDDILAGKTPDIDSAIAELNTTSNRGFVPGFLEGNPKDNAIYYEKKTSNQTHLFAGIVRKVISSSKEKSIIEVEARSKFDIGDELEFVFPKDVKLWKVTNILKPVDNGEDIKLESASGGLEFNVKIEVPFEVKDEYCVIRRKLKEGEIA